MGALRVEIPPGVTDFPATYVFRTYAPEIGAAALNFSRTVYASTCLSLREMEAARIRVGHTNACSLCKAVRAHRDLEGGVPTSSETFARPMSSRGPIPGDDFYEAIPHWRTATLFSERERLAIEYAEKLGEDPQGVGEDEHFWSRMRAHFSDAEITDLSLSLASWIGIGRVMHAVGLDNVCMPALGFD